MLRRELKRVKNDLEAATSLSGSRSAALPSLFMKHSVTWLQRVGFCLSYQNCLCFALETDSQENGQIALVLDTGADPHDYVLKRKAGPFSSQSWRHLATKH